MLDGAQTVSGGLRVGVVGCERRGAWCFVLVVGRGGALWRAGGCVVRVTALQVEGLEVATTTSGAATEGQIDDQAGVRPETEPHGAGCRQWIP